MSRLSTLREFASTPREVHVIAYGFVAGLTARKVLAEIRREPQYFLVALVVGLAIADRLRGEA